MSWIAWKMLTGDRAKYAGIVAGVTFAALLIAQQASIGWGLFLRTTAQVQDIADVDIWVLDPNVEFIDELKPLTEDDLYRVQGVPGVAWAVRFYKGQGRIKLGAGMRGEAGRGGGPPPPPDTKARGGGPGAPPPAGGARGGGARRPPGAARPAP